MKRRTFLKGGAVAGATTLVAAPAIAQGAPEIKWRLTSSFPKSLDTIYGTAQTFAKYVAEATDNKFQIQTFAAGELVPGLQALDAVSVASVEMAQTPLYFYIGKEPALAYATGAPFGMNHRHQESWWYFGGGADLTNEALKPFKTHAILCGNSGTQMGGWFRKEIKTVDDLKGLKFRIAGMGGHVLARLGIVPQQLAGGDVYAALEKGSIDAAEFVGPYDDEKLGFQKVAKYYYFPGWWEGGAMLHMIVNDEKWASLPKQYQGDRQSGCLGGRRLDAGEIRQRESGGPEAADRQRRGAEGVPAAGAGGLLQRDPGASERARRQERFVQAHQGEPRRLYEGAAVLHADRGKLLRQLSAQQDAE
ncbi:TRAP-type mannitol/chloroaromatic compound transport system substrate-binding protein [Bradyrhizobium japonicum]